MYLYPKNLNDKPMMWVWYIKDITVIIILTVLSVLLLVNIGSIIMASLTTVYAILTIRLEDTSILDYIKYSCIFFFTKQEFKWRNDG